MRKHTVAEVMTRDVVSVRATTGYKEIVETLANHSVSAVPVVDEAGRLLGVVSEADLLYKTEYADQPHPSATSRTTSTTASTGRPSSSRFPPERRRP